jgi:membrane protein insertase Oxa1/YidC/SpoIIIJ
MHGMREMQALQPYIKEIQEKYKDDRQRMQREQMALWEHG